MSLPSNSVRVLLAEENLAFRRVMREALVAFRSCEVDEAASGEHAFELAMQRPYGLFIFSQTLPDMQGELLDRLIGKAYGRVHAHIHSAPPLIYLLRQAELPLWLELSRHARVRAHVLMPPRLDMLMRSVEGIVAAREGGPPTL